MKKKNTTRPRKAVPAKTAETEQSKNNTPSANKSTDETRFCLNCDDMDDLATGDDASDVKTAYERFHKCQETGNFDGDICSRIFVADDQFDDAIMPSDEDEDQLPG